MPQLDKLTFVDQSLSVLFFFLALYVLSVYFFLPRIVFVVRFRNRFFSLFKARYFNKDNKLSTIILRSKAISKCNFSFLYLLSTFVFMQSKELLRVIRYISLKFMV